MFGRRPTASSTCEPTTSGGRSVQSTATATPSVVSRQADALGVRADRDALALPGCPRIASETSSSSRAIRRGAISIDRHLGAEAPVHLGELQADVAAADDDEVPRQRVERQDRGVGEERHVVDAGQIGHVRAAADVDEDARRRQPLVADADACPADSNRAWPWKTVQPVHAAQPALDAGARVRRHRVGARLDPGHVDLRTAPR